jgi:signal peptidase I
VLDYSVAAPKPPSRRGYGFLTVCANFVLPGLGFWIIGRRRRAVAWFAVLITIAAAAVVAMCFPSLVPALLVLLPLSVALQLLMLVDGYRLGRNAPRKILSSPLLRYLAGCAILVLLGVISPGRRVGIVIRDHVVEAFLMPTQGMAPTLYPRDRFLVHKGLPVRRWDVVAFLALPPEQPDKYCKRIVGLPGEQVELVGDKVFINGKPIPLPAGLGPYQSNPPIGPRIGCHGPPIRLGPDVDVVLGVNSPISGDSRYWDQGMPGHQPGALPAGNIIGRATWVYWPPSYWKRL